MMTKKGGQNNVSIDLAEWFASRRRTQKNPITQQVICALITRINSRVANELLIITFNYKQIKTSLFDVHISSTFFSNKLFSPF